MNQERKKILELVQKGKLSAQEAIILLEALEDGGNNASVSETEQVKTTPQPQQSEKTYDEDFSESQSSEKQEQEKTNKEDSFYTQLESAGEKIFDFVNNALNKIKHFDFQFNQSVDVPHTFQQADTGIERIEVDVANGPVRLVSWDQSEIRIECQAKVYRSEDREDARNYFIENTVFTVENEMLIFATQSKWMRVETVVYIPKKHYKKISVRIFNGGLTSEELEAKYLTVKTTNGKIELTNIEGEKLDIDTVNGQIKLSNSNALQLEAETVNGAIEAIGQFENVDLQSFNGNIACTLTENNTNKFEAKAVTGNIKLIVPGNSTVDGDVRSNLGNYKLDLDGIDVMHEKKEIIQKQVKFKRTGTDDHVIHVLADTKTGSVNIGEAKTTVV
ncbi:DUF4097 family beta strand repeat-containing protein [Lederbergia wuyishanensis]|uniref:DUF4097 and DUF4098 domain-containing protein YvlB n=1 Tax=Lederbergia wuyishanensis TaxID=1347903 RepID=A0ABU0D8K7_9BACI|nr:DUF4097 domain-containing protein [Lederbergia wuyishanensis]MCJ8007681.1 DUF4097 family beta strand repeat-containing protein [Lederbergia wuyishanensis]MDQ0344735.1 DUF4097 and DUF4098 domain-containing protein YvlB [Lederbergia wuyishanensis]